MVGGEQEGGWKSEREGWESERKGWKVGEQEGGRVGR